MKTYLSHRLILIIICLMSIALISACGVSLGTGYPPEPSTDVLPVNDPENIPDADIVSPGAPAEDPEDPGGSVTDEDTTSAGNSIEDILNYYTEFISDRANNRFIRFEFNTKEEIDLTLVFYDDFMFKDSDGEYYAYNINDEERAAFRKISGYGFTGGDITRVYVPEAIDFLRDMTGYDFSREELGTSLNASGHSWIYIENWDSYYHEHGDTAYRLVTCVDVIELDNGQTEIYYHYADGAGENAVLTIQEIDGRTVFLSNRYL